MDKYFKLIFFLLALLIGIIYISPHLFRFWELQKSGEVYIPLTQQADFDIMNVHGARYREIIDNNLFAGDVDSYEHKDGPAIWPLLSADILAPFLLWADSPFPMLYLTDWLWPIFTFIAFFLVFRVLTGNRWYAVWFAFFLLLFPQFPLLFPPSSVAEIKNIWYQLIPFPAGEHLVSNLTYLRREAFIPGAPFFLLALYWLALVFLAEEKKPKAVLLAGIFLGLLFYFYLYFWLFAFTMIGVWLMSILIYSLIRLMVYWLRRTRDELGKSPIGKAGNEIQKLFLDLKIGAIVQVIGIALVVSIPFWISHWRLAALPQYNELGRRAGIELGRTFRLEEWPTYVLSLLLAALVFYFARKIGKNKPGWFLGAIALVPILVLNLQVFSGFNIQSDHWSGRVFLMSNGIVFGALGYYFFAFVFQKWKSALVPKGRRVIQTILFIILICIVLNNLFTQFVVARRDAHLFTLDPRLAQAYAWLNRNTPPDSVVFSPLLDTNIDLSVYTHSRLFLARAQTSLASEVEVLDRLYHGYTFLEIPEKEIEKILTTHGGIIYFFSSQYEPHTLDRHLHPERYGPFDLPREVRERVVNDYRRFVKDETFQPYRIDYIFIGPKERELGINEKVLDSYEMLYARDGVKIYRFEKKANSD